MGKASLLLALFLATVLFSVATAVEDFPKFDYGVKFMPGICDVKAQKGDKVDVHYRGTLVDGSEFDSSYGRGSPFSFTLGKGMVIKGWEVGIEGMCLGEKRNLQIPSNLGYGPRGYPPVIPGGAGLVFDTELVAVNGQKYTPGNGDVDL